MSIPALPADSSSLTPIFPNEQCPLDWGDRGGPCWRCWPTDGESCGQWIEECICSICCQLCTETKAYSYSLGQPCAIINHCCPVCCCPLLAGALTRYNTRYRSARVASAHRPSQAAPQDRCPGMPRLLLRSVSCYALPHLLLLSGTVTRSASHAEELTTARFLARTTM